MSKDIKSKLANLTKEQKLELLEAIEEKKRRKREQRAVFKPNPVQERIITSKADKRIVIAGNGCWAPGTLVRMYDGSTKAVEDVAIGDKLMAPDNTLRIVIKLFSGTEEMYKIIPKHSDPYTVNASHILTLKKWSKARIGEPGYKPGAAIIRPLEIKLSDFLKLGKEAQRISYQWRPVDGIEYPEKELPIDPYILGTWLGDGTSESLAITSMDNIIVNAWKDYFKGYKISIQEKEGNKAKTYQFTQNIRSPNIGSHGRQALVKLNLIKNKHIPDIYKKASKKQRLELLAGIIDTDGHLDKHTGYEITQVRERLLDDIREVAQSLGFSISKVIKMINGKPYYRAHMYGKIHNIPVRLPHKKADPKYRKQRQRNYEGFTVEPQGPGQFYGFMLDGDNLLMLADYTAQHNSGKTAIGVNEAFWAAEGYNPITKENTPVPAKIIVVLDSPEKVADVWLPEMKKWRVINEENLHKRGKPYYTEMTFDNGSSIRWMFHLQEDLSYESLSNLDLVIMDEPPPRNIWVALLRGGRQKGRRARYLLIGTPIAQPWLREYYNEWEKGNFPDTEFLKGSTQENAANLSKNYIEEFSRHLTEHEKRTRLHGEFFNAEGMALAGLWKRDKHLVSESALPTDYKSSWPHVIAIDNHPNKPHFACMLAAAPNGKKYYVGEVCLKVVPREFAKWLKANWIYTYNVIDIVCDNAGQADYTGGEGFLSFIEVLKQEGVRVRATSYDEKSADDFMERIQEGLYIPEAGEPLLQFIIGKSNGVVKDIENVQWKRQKGTEEYQPKLEIGNTDYLACLKYALAANLTYQNANRKPKSMLQSKPALMGNARKPGYLDLALQRRRRPDIDDDDW